MNKYNEEHEIPCPSRRIISDFFIKHEKELAILRKRYADPISLPKSLSEQQKLFVNSMLNKLEKSRKYRVPRLVLASWILKLNSKVLFNEFVKTEQSFNIVSALNHYDDKLQELLKHRDQFIFI